MVNIELTRRFRFFGFNYTIHERFTKQVNIQPLNHLVDELYGERFLMEWENPPEVVSDPSEPGNLGSYIVLFKNQFI